ncbi:hypothetical protein D3C83_148210 [compost metagenome]
MSSLVAHVIGELFATTLPPSGMIEEMMLPLTLAAPSFESVPESRMRAVRTCGMPVTIVAAVKGSENVHTPVPNVVVLPALK